MTHNFTCGQRVAGKERSYRNHELWRRGKPEFLQERHIRSYVGGEIEGCQKPRPCGWGQGRSFGNPALCGRRKTEFQQAGHVWTHVDEAKG